jgi:hypothetical protein
MPSVVSWSVKAKALRPAVLAVSTSWVGVRVPSDKVEWVWRSTLNTGHLEDLLYLLALAK